MHVAQHQAGPTDRLDRSMAPSDRPTGRRGAVPLLAGGLLLVAALTGCGGAGNGTASAPHTLPGSAGPASGDPAISDPPASTTPSEDTTGSSPAAHPPSPTAATPPRTSGRCHTADLRASIGRNDPGAGQENFPVVLTNRSARTCTVYGLSLIHI